MDAAANFGLFKRDKKIAKLIREISDRTGYPRSVQLAWSKNLSDDIIEYADILGDLVVFEIALQSMDDKVLKLIKRYNISEDTIIKVQKYLNENQGECFSELILGLPGETKDSHEKALKKLLALNIGQILVYNLRLVGGCELTSKESRNKFEIKSKRRLYDGAFGKYGPILAFEIEEVGIGTNTLTQEEILFFRPVQWLVQMMWNYKYYIVLLRFLQSEDINVFDYLVKIISNAGEKPGVVEDLFKGYIKDSREELFDSEDQIIEYYQKKENFDYISKGGFSKLNFKYTFKVILECKKDFDDYVFEIAKDLLMEKEKMGTETVEILKDIKKYNKYSYINFNNLSKVGDVVVEKEFKYDILSWKTDGFVGSLRNCKKDTKVKYVFKISKEQKNNLNKLIKQFETSNFQLTISKMVEYMNLRDLLCKVDFVSE